MSSNSTKSVIRFTVTIAIFLAFTIKLVLCDLANATTIAIDQRPNVGIVSIVSNVTSKNEISNTNVSSAASSHMCTREETYIEQMQTPSLQQFRVRSSEWCLRIPPRCSSYKTEFREVIKVQNVKKIRTIRYCCEGYTGILSSNDTICKPICRGGCGRGSCQSPDQCHCDAGYTGTHCTQTCQQDRWGESCKEKCHCRNGSLCDNKLGICHCTAGWIGKMCELPCPQGYHGIMCRKTCECSSNQCNPRTGDCIVAIDNSLIPLNPPIFYTNDNITSTMIKTLNSTIVNITHNLDRIAKNLATTRQAATTITHETVTLLVPDLIDVTTLKPVPEVIVIKPSGEHQNPSIIVHRQDVLENIHSTAAKAPKVIHVITDWREKQSENGEEYDAADKNDTKIDLAKTRVVVGGGGGGGDHDSTILATMLIVLLFLLIFIVIGFLYFYWRYRYQNECTHSSNTGRHHLSDGGAILSESIMSNACSKPLPDLPAFSQILHTKIDAREFYDSPKNNGAVKEPYCYARKESLYSVIPAKSRKGSMDSHLYDEIRYPLHSHNHHHLHRQYNQQQQQQQHFQHTHNSNESTLHGIETNNSLAVPSIEYHTISHM